MRIAVIVLALTGFISVVRGQSRPNVDTMSLGGMKTHQPSNLINQLQSYDTIFWNADAGAGMLRSASSLFGHKGEYRVAIQEKMIQQVTFAIGAHSKTEAKKFYDEVYSQLTGWYGQPDGSSATEFRWEGMEQFYAVRLSEEGNDVNIVLSKFEGR
jgi:hypothetical protein